MGAGQSAEIPGGGSEGYHVLRVSICVVTACEKMARAEVVTRSTIS